MKQREDKKKVILLLPPLQYPIPAVGGGAVEQLITHLLDVNEVAQQAKFIVVSKYDERAQKIQYHHSEIRYLDENGFVIGYRRRFKFLWMLYCTWQKVFHNHIAEKLFARPCIRMDKYRFQCYLLAKIRSVDYIVNELHNMGFDPPLEVFNSVVGRENFYTHIHSVRRESLSSRRVINNSISISEYVRKQWVVDQTIPGRNEVLYNCIDVGRFCNTLCPEERRQMRQGLGIDDNDFLVIFCGRLIEIKGIKELLEAFDLLATQHEDNIKLLLIGSEAFSQGNTTEFSKEMMDKARKNPKIIPMGYIPNAELPKYYALSDAQIVPSICQEGAGLVAIEGMATGLPLIITKSGGMPEYVGEGTSIQLPIDEQLPQNIADAISHLAHDPKLCEQLGNKGRERAGKFSREAYYSGFLAILNRE